MGTSETASLESWVAAINAAMGTSFAIEEPGRLFLEFPGDIRIGVDFPEGARSYDIYAPIAYLNGAAELPRLLAALELNLYQRGTAGGVIGFDSFSAAFIYSFSFPVEQSSAEILARQIDQFAGHAARLREALEKAAGDIDAVELENLAGKIGMIREEEVERQESDDHVGNEAPPPAHTMIRI
jgi:hypothetical protein